MRSLCKQSKQPIPLKLDAVAAPNIADEKPVRIPEIKEPFLQARERFAKRRYAMNQATISVPFGQ
jgi:hypothetical protein